MMKRLKWLTVLFAFLLIDILGIHELSASQSPEVTRLLVLVGAQMAFWQLVIWKVLSSLVVTSKLSTVNLRN